MEPVPTNSATNNINKSNKMLRSRRVLRVILLAIIILLLLLIFGHLKKQTPKTLPKDVFIAAELFDDQDINRRQVVNFTQFQYKINNKLCQEYDRELLGIIIITSYSGHDALRSEHRRAISQRKLQEMGLIRVFLLAELPDREKFITQKQIIHENNRFKDIVQGNFIEDYRNLTYKHIMGLKWATMECQKAKFIIKADDDIVFDVFFLRKYLQNFKQYNQDKSLVNFIAGYAQENKTPIRITANKWYVSRDEYTADSYPDYLSGWLYITNVATALMLILQSQQESFFWIDDIYVTGVLRSKIGIPIIKMNQWFSANPQFLECCIRDLKNSLYECNYIAGPNGGDDKLIADFIHSIEKCYFDECIKRPPEHALNKTCVGAVKDLLNHHGEASIQEVPIG